MQISIELVSQLVPGQTLPQVRAMLQHAFDHDGHLPIGEHIYLKLKAGQPPLQAGLANKLETAAALLAYSEVAAHHENDLPENNFETKHLLVGYLQFLMQPEHVPPRLTCEVLVHPHFRQHKIGQKLWTELVQIAHHLHIHELNMWAYHYQPEMPVVRFAEAIGAQPARVLYHLRRPASLALPEIDLPPDVRVRAFRPGYDDAEWLALNHLIFASHPENGSWTAADLELRFAQKWFHPEDFLVLEDTAGRMVGFHWTKITPSSYSDLHNSPAYVESSPQEKQHHPMIKTDIIGEIYIVGLHPAMHGRGLGKVLTLLGMHHLVKRGSDQLALYVDEDNHVAVKLYFALGFTLHHQDVCYSVRG